MLRAIRTLTISLRPAYYFQFSQDKTEFVPSVIDQGRDFYSSIYGVCLEKHVFPYCSYHLNWKASQLA